MYHGIWGNIELLHDTEICSHGAIFTRHDVKLVKSLDIMETAVLMN